MSSPIIKDANAAYTPWQLPVVEDMSAAVAEARENKASGLLTAEKIEQIQAEAYKEAYEAGFAEGQAAGLAAGEEAVNRNLQLLASVLETLAEPLKQLDQAVEEELISLAVAIARQLVRRELKANPGEVVAVVQEALGSLPVASREVRVVLHPEDAQLLRDSLMASENDRNWRLDEDPSLSRGDCRVLSETSRIEATLEHRLASVVAQLLDGERRQTPAPESGQGPEPA